MIAPRTSAAGRRASAVDTLAALSTLFERAVARFGATVVHARVAGRVVEVQLAGDALTDKLTNLLLTTSRTDESPNLVLGGWDNASGAAPSPPVPPRAWFETGGRSVFADGSMLAFCRGSQSLQAYVPARRAGYYWVRSAESIPGWDAAAPFRTLLAAWAESWGGVLAHAAVVGNGRRGVLLVGKSGAGKSTAALACASEGLGLPERRLRADET